MSNCNHETIMDDESDDKTSALCHVTLFYSSYHYSNN